MPSHAVGLPQVRSPMGNLRAQGRAFTIHTASVSRLPAGGDVEGVEEHAGVMPAIADAVEARHALSSHATALPFMMQEPAGSQVPRRLAENGQSGRWRGGYRGERGCRLRVMTRKPSKPHPLRLSQCP